MADDDSRQPWDEELDDPRLAGIARPALGNAEAVPSTAVRGLPAPAEAAPTTGSTEDLEGHSLASHIGAAAAPAPVAGSTADLEGHSLASHIAGPGGSNDTGVRGLRPQPTDPEFQAPKMPLWEKILTPIAIGAGTAGHPEQQTKLIDQIYNEPQRQAEEKYKTASAAYEKQQEDELKQGQLETTQEKNQTQLEKQYRQLGLKKDAQGNFVPIPYEEMSPTEQAAHDLKTNQAELADARSKAEQLKGDPNSPLYQAQLQRMQIAEQNAKNAAQRLGLSQEQFANKKTEQGLLKPSGQAQSRGSAADAALTILPDLENEIKANAANLGPIMGRIQRGEIALGDVDPKIAKLYASLNSFYALNPSIHGFRNYELVKDMPSLIGGLSRDPEATIAGLEGLKPTLESVAKEGKTFHKRIVEGKETEGAAPGKGKTLPMSAIQQAAKDNGISVDEAKKQANAAGYSIQ